MKISAITAMVLTGLMLSGMSANSQPVSKSDATASQPKQTTVAAQEAGEAPPAQDVSGAAIWAAKAAKVLETQMAEIPDKRAPEAITEHARCVAVFPSVLKAGFVVGAKRGDGLITCRDDEPGSWGAPAFFRIKGVSWGAQIGAQSADVILMIMNQEGVDGLLKAKVSLGGDIAITAGPVGRNASVSTDLLLKSPIISYARSKGVFAGIGLEGSTITFNKEENEKLYGAGVDASTIIFKTANVPEELKVFHTALTVYAPHLKQIKEPQTTTGEPEVKDQTASETSE